MEMIRMKGLFDDHGEEGDYAKRNEVILRNIDSFWEANSESESEDSLEGGSGGGDGHFQPPFVQRARDTRKVWFCEIFFIFI